MIVLKDWIDGTVNGRLKNITAQLEENGMNDGLGLVFDDGWDKNYDPSSERSRGSYRSFAVLSVLPTADIGGLEFMALHCSGRMRKQDRGLIDLGCDEVEANS